MTRYSKIIGTGSALPPDCVSNAELVRRLAERGIETSDEWIVERTGIRQRYLADPNTASSHLATQAARAALEAAGRQAADVDLIIVATSTPDYVFPSTACLVQKALGNAGGAAFDVQAVCSGFVYAMATADAMIRTGMASRALVIGAEVFSRILDWTDRGTCVLFGDGAGAVLLEASDEPGVGWQAVCMRTGATRAFCVRPVMSAAVRSSVRRCSRWTARRYSSSLFRSSTRWDAKCWRQRNYRLSSSTG